MEHCIGRGLLLIDRLVKNDSFVRFSGGIESLWEKGIKKPRKGKEFVVVLEIQD